MAKPSVKFNNGCEMPVFGFGTWLAASGVVANSVKLALECGYKHIDCASIYDNESEIGEVFGTVFTSGNIKREDIFITSKLWVKDFCNVKESCQSSLKNLQLEYLDLYLIHLPFELDKNSKGGIPDEKGVGVIGYEPKRMQEVWKNMEELVDAGLVKSIGISNFTSKKVTDLLSSSPRIRPACNQIELHPYLPQDKLFELCKKEDIAIVAYTPFGNPGRPASFKADNEPSLLGDPVITAVAEKHKATNAQVLLAWHVKRGTGVLAKSVTESRIKENLGCLQVHLDDEDMKKIGAITARFRFIPQSWATKKDEETADLWDGEMFG